MKKFLYLCLIIATIVNISKAYLFLKQSNSNNEIIRFTYVNRISTWSSAAAIARGMGVPGYAPDHQYNYVCLTFWLADKGPWDMVKVWENPIAYMGAG